MMSGSGHKIGAPKGIGWLLIRRGIHLAAQIHGGGQQRGLRSGTENPPLAGALAHALRLATEKLSEQCVQVAELRSQLLSHLTARKVDLSGFVAAERCSAHSYGGLSRPAR
jgi:cysteine desulfurase